MFDGRHMKPAGGAVIALQVDDVAKTCTELVAKGIKVFEGPKVTSWGQTVAYLHDPDGHIIELTS
jgi:lactoylglutathione lyase